MKRFSLLAVVALVLAAGGLYAKEEMTARHAPMTDPKVYIPLREEMTRMEMRFVDVQIMAAEEKVDFKAMQKALAEMEAASKKIRSINPNEALTEPLQSLGDQLNGLQRDARRKDLSALKGNLDRLFQTCFKCHQAHAPMM